MAKPPTSRASRSVGVLLPLLLHAVACVALVGNPGMNPLVDCLQGLDRSRASTISDSNSNFVRFRNHLCAQTSITSELSEDENIFTLREGRGRVFAHCSSPRTERNRMQSPLKPCLHEQNDVDKSRSNYLNDVPLGSPFSTGSIEIDSLVRLVPKQHCKQGSAITNMHHSEREKYLACRTEETNGLVKQIFIPESQSQRLTPVPIADESAKLAAAEGALMRVENVLTEVCHQK
jgi:hypothetical protein